MEAKEPCIGCPNKVIDEWGYFCGLSCGKRIAWLNYMEGIKEVVKDLTNQMNGNSYWGKNCKQNRKSQCKCCQDCPIVKWQSKLKDGGIDVG